MHLTFYAYWHKSCPLRSCAWDGRMITQNRHKTKYVAYVVYLFGCDSSIKLTELSSLINHLNYLRFRRLRRRSASPSGYTPFLSYVHLSCVTFSLFLHERKTRWSGVTIQRTSSGPLKTGSQHSTTLNHARLVLTFHIRWKNSSCSTRILWTGWRKIRGELWVIYGSLTSFPPSRTHSSEDPSEDRLSLVSVSPFFAPAHLTPHYCCISLLNPH